MYMSCFCDMHADMPQAQSPRCPERDHRTRRRRGGCPADTWRVVQPAPLPGGGGACGAQRPHSAREGEGGGQASAGGEACSVPPPAQELHVGAAREEGAAACAHGGGGGGPDLGLEAVERGRVAREEEPLQPVPSVDERRGGEGVGEGERA